MLIPGVDFTTIGKFAAAYFKCVNDNGGINGRPIDYILYNEQLNPTQEASLARSSWRATRSSASSATRASPSAGRTGSTTSPRASRDRRGCAGRVLRHAADRRVQHGSALQQHRRRPGARQARREVARRRIARHDLSVRRRWRRSWSPRPRASRATSSRSSSRSRTRTRRSCSSCRQPALAVVSSSTSRPIRRRHRCRRPSRRASSTRCCGARRRHRERRDGEAVPAVRRQDAHRPGVRNINDGTPDENLYLQITKRSRRASRRRRSVRWASWTRSSRPRP